MSHESAAREKIAILVNLVYDLRGTVEAIQNNFADDGFDSLACIDYGAHANALIQQVRDAFQACDDACIFTMGND